MNNESPIECVIREVKEELNIFLTQQEIIWQKKFPYRNGNLPSYFMVAKLNPDMIEKICLGEEGQQWKLIPINKFLSSQNVISHLQKRLRIYLNTKI
jgi:8-oxo-dGTP diphosphatase